MTLPVARCGDCLYWQEEACECKKHGFFPHSKALNIGLSGWPLTVSSDWCGEFIHRKLGRRWRSDAPLSSAMAGSALIQQTKQWRFPTEGE